MTTSNSLYRVESKGRSWTVNHDGTFEGEYATKEAAFEAIVGAASNSIKSGIGVTIEIPGTTGDEPSLGAR